MKTRNILLACAVTAVAGANKARAEGGDKRPQGALGVNRRVATPPGYTEVSGTFALDCQLPTHPNGAATDDGGTTDEYRGPHDDIPQFYMGSSIQDAAGFTPITTDAGIGWGYIGPNVNHISDGDVRRNRGWRYFYRINAPLGGVPTDAPTEIRVWNSSTRASSIHGFNFSRPLNSILGHRIYEGDDPSTSVMERAGQSSLTVRFWGTGNPTGDRIVYGRRIGAPRNLYTFTTTLVGQHAANATVLTVASVREFAMYPNADVIVGGANRPISAVDYAHNTIRTYAVCI